MFMVMMMFMYMLVVSKIESLLVVIVVMHSEMRKVQPVFLKRAHYEVEPSVIIQGTQLAKSDIPTTLQHSSSTLYTLFLINVM
jgi:hypothetical protein